MLLAPVFRWFPGWVRVELEGGYTERLLNAMTAGNVSMWHVRRRGEGMRFSCYARDYRRLRGMARHACMRMHLVSKHGMPFLLHRYRRRRFGLAAGLAVYVAILALLSPRIWAVEVVGNADTSTASILEVAAQMGVKPGARMDRLEIKRLEIEGLSRLPSLAWITVNPSGSVARVEVTERRPTPQVLDLSEPSDMVALRDGVILSMWVRSGNRVAMDGEAVRAGDLLITGRQESEVGVQLYRSYGEVWAQTRRQITVSVPLTYQLRQTDGGVVFRPTLTFLCWDIPLYSNGPLGDGYLHTQKRHFLQAGGLTLPLGLIHDYYIHTTATKTARTRQEAKRLAEQQLAEQEQALFGAGRFEELSRQATIEDGAYVLSVSYRCEENIAVEVPLGETLP